MASRFAAPISTGAHAGTVHRPLELAPPSRRTGPMSSRHRQVCKVVIRSNREFRPGDRVYCMPCMSRMVIVRRGDGRLEAEVSY